MLYVCIWRRHIKICKVNMINVRLYSDNLLCSMSKSTQYINFSVLKSYYHEWCVIHEPHFVWYSLRLTIDSGIKNDIGLYNMHYILLG